jgi:hypothetical protein
MTATCLFLCAGFLAGADGPRVGDQGTRADGWVLVHKPRYELLPASRVVIPETAPRQGYTKRPVSVPGEALPIHAGAASGSPALSVDRITVTGGKVGSRSGRPVADAVRVPGTFLS